jgi:shikimate dehydrogenase
MTIDRYFVLGNPVAHSQSPFIHAAFATQTGQALAYERRLCALDGFAAAVHALADDAGDDAQVGPVRGCNVTMPFKFEAFALATHHTPRAVLAQAANVLRFDAGGWLADNTDGAGLVQDIEGNAGMPVAGRRVLLIGAGGAAAGVLGPLVACRPALLTVVNRTAGKAADLVARHADWAAEYRVDLRAGAIAATATLGGPFDIVINASSSSVAGAAVPISADVLAAGALVVDLMYGPAAEPFLAWARTHGATARDGLGMLVEQAAQAFVLWRGVQPQTAPVLAALRARLQAAA